LLLHLDGHRELAFQISEQFVVLGSPLNVRTAVIVGGMDMMAQAIELNNLPHVVVATPGRLVDHLRSSSAEWDLSRVKFLVFAITTPGPVALYL
jgi:ATP-dependent RNA helicase DDX49/DBP8